MLKGCRKQLVMLKPGEDSVFESAWFVLREERVQTSYVDMIAEANRIVSGGRLPRRRGRLGWRMLLLGMLLGVLLGGGVATLFFLL